MSTQKRSILSVLSVTFLVVLAGCGALPGVGPSVSNIEADLVNDQPAVTFDYDIDDYATALLEGPNDRIITEARIEPDYSSGALYMPDPRPGEYTVVVRQGGETVASESVTFEGADPEVQGVETEWSGNRISSVSISVQNNGDLPIVVESAGFSAAGQDIEIPHMLNFIETNGTTEIEIAPSEYGETVTVEESGVLEGEARLQTSTGEITGHFSETLEPASLTIESVDPVWNGNELQEVRITATNTGDLPTTANALVSHDGETIEDTADGRLQAGETGEFSVESFGTLYTVESGGNSQFEAVVNSSEGTVSETFSREVTGADVSIESMDTTWEQAQLTSVEFSAENAGDVDAEYPATIEVNGETVQEGTVEIPGGDVSDLSFTGDSWSSDSLYTATSGGEHTVTLNIETGEGTVTASDSKEFEGIDYSISNVDALFIDVYDSDQSQLSNVDFSVRNEGDVPIRYDTVKVSLDGVSQSDSMYSATEVMPGESTTAYPSFSDFVVDSGTHNLTIELVAGGETVAQTSVSVSTE